MKGLTTQETVAVVSMALALIECTPEAAEVAASPYVDQSELSLLADKLRRIAVEEGLPELRSCFVKGFKS